MKKLLRLLLLTALPFTLNAQNEKQLSPEYAFNLVKKNAYAAGISNTDLKNIRIADAYYGNYAKAYLVYVQQTYKSVDVQNLISTLVFKNEKLVAGDFKKNPFVEKRCKRFACKTCNGHKRCYNQSSSSYWFTKQQPV